MNSQTKRRDTWAHRAGRKGGEEGEKRTEKRTEKRKNGHAERAETLRRKG